MPDRALLRWLLITAGLLFALIWLLSATHVIGTVPGWIPPLSVICGIGGGAVPP